MRQSRPSHPIDYLGLACAAILCGLVLCFVAWRTEDHAMGVVGVVVWLAGAVGFFVVAAFPPRE